MNTTLPHGTMSTTVPHEMTDVPGGTYRPGFKTTEFYTCCGVQVAAFVVAMSSTDATAKIMTGIVAALAIVGYLTSRHLHKAALVPLLLLCLLLLPGLAGAQDYDAAVSTGAKLGKPVVAFYGVPGRTIPGALTATPPSLDIAGPCVVVAIPKAGQWSAWRLPATATDAEIRQLAGLGVAVQAPPFGLDQLARPPAADDRQAIRGPWIDGLEFPEGFVRYTPAKYTQHLAENGRVSNGTDPSIAIIRPVPRSETELKYRVPGGLEKATGWRSDLYRRGGAQAFKGRITVWNGGYYKYLGGAIVYENGEPKKSWQQVLGWKREYPVGTAFMDVLSKDGVVFEVRMAEKETHGWHRFVDYRDVAARPTGFRPVRSQECASCHKDAGSGAYGVGLAPGADQTFSDPFAQLER